MAMPRKANVGVRGHPVNIDTATYFIAKRMEQRGMLRPGQALMLAATLPSTTKKTTKRSAKK